MNGEQVEVRRDKSGELPFWRVVLSVIQASFGVQSDVNRQRDFGQSNFLPYVVAALIFVSVFVLSLMFVVSMVLDA